MTEVDDMLRCDVCGGFLRLLGTLGYLVHFRCQDCGMQQSRDTSVWLDQDFEVPSFAQEEE